MDVHTFSVLYQDHHLLVVNKPAGVVMHPTYKHVGDTMWDAILHYLAQQGPDGWQPPDLPDEPQWAGAPPDIQVMLRARRLEYLWKEEGLLARPVLLHRLDKDTSGVVALARTGHACDHLARQFHEHTVDKRYLALVQRGAPDWAQPRVPLRCTHVSAEGDVLSVSSSCDVLTAGTAILVLEGPLQRDPVERRRCIVGPGGQAATTRLRVLAVGGEMALLEVNPITGRTHQIRAHLAASGYAIVGDQVYGVVSTAAALSRQFLHAWQLTLRTYPGNTRTTFVAPLPDDLLNWLQRHFPEALEALAHRQAEGEA